MRTNLNKPFFVQAVEGGEKLHVRSHSARFDTVNQYHGGEPTGQLSISIRVDGRFTEGFRAQVPDPGKNLASRASLWASQDLEPPVRERQASSPQGALDSPRRQIAHPKRLDPLDAPGYPLLTILGG